jgi:type I restriction enzyme S subunit
VKNKPYPAYKDSGVEWIGKVPEHWRIVPLKALAQIVNGATPESGNPEYWDGDIAWFTPADLDNENASELIEPRRRITAEGLASCAARLTPASSVILSTRAPVGSVGVTLIPSATNQGCRTLVPNPRILPKLLAEMLVAARSELSHRSNGTTFQELSTDSLASLRIPLAPLEEQTAIVSSLDRETARIDALIAKQEKLIELLQEKREALISHAVTKGLNPDAPMKDSGVEWLGEVPEHWEVKRLRFVGDAIIGLTYDPSEITDETEGMLVLRSSNVQGGRISFEDNVYVSTVIPEKLITRVGDILICSRNGSRALIGKNAKIDSDSAGVTFGAFMTIFRSDSNAFLFYVFNSMIFDYQAGSFMTSTVNQLTIGNLYGFEVPMPPIDEQSIIVEYLGQETAKLDTLIEKSRRSIELMREHRTALISAAVTGKIDVRTQHQAAA